MRLDKVMQNHPVRFWWNAISSREGPVVDHNHEKDKTQKPCHQGYQHRMYSRVFDFIEVADADANGGPHPNNRPHNR